MLKDTLTPNPSPSGRGEQNEKPLPFPEREASEASLVLEQNRKEAVFRAAASAVMVRIARDLRQRETSAEDILWQALRNRRLASLKFRRQHPIANTAFVADFICYDARLIIELDGKIHQNQQEADEQRQAAIESEEYVVIRFTNEQIKQDLESNLAQIAKLADQLITQRKSPSPRGRRI
jgi:very-short-patch-repair endonuclease